MTTKAKPEAKERKLCGAKLRNKDKTCRRSPIRGAKRCRLHGGLTPSGEDSPNWKHGRYSKYLSPDAIVCYEEHINDQESLDVNGEIGLLSYRISQLGKRVTGAEAINVFDIQAIAEKIRDGVSDGSNAKIQNALAELQILLERQESLETGWDDLLKATEERRKLVEVKMKFEKDMGRFIPLKQARAFMASLFMIVKEETERHARNGALADTIYRAVGARTSQLFSR